MITMVGFRRDCAVWDLTGCAATVAAKAAEGIFEVIANAVIDAIKWIIVATVSWWVSVPSESLCDTDRDRLVAVPLEQCHSVAATVQSWMVPVTVIIALGGVLWNALQMIISRRPQPLFAIVKGLFTTALWSAVGIVGVDLLLKGTDKFSIYILSQAVHDLDAGKLAERMTTLLVPAAELGMAAPLVIIVGLVILIATFIQALLMLFRDGSIIILAGLLPLAAAGNFTQATSGWLRKLMAWMLSLIFYKPMAAMVYAVAFLLIGGQGSQNVRTFFIGVAMLALSLIALPVMMKFFNWTVGGLQSGGGGLGMLAGAGAAGLHAGATLRGAGGRGVNDHARYMDQTMGGGGSAPPAGAGTGSAPGPGRGPGPAPAPPKPPAFVGGTGSAGAGAGAGAAAGAGAGAGAAGSSAAMGAAAATGPAAPAVAGVVMVGQAAVKAAKAGASAADGATT